MLGVQVTTRLPKRFSEGYGLSEKIIDEIDSGLLITVDNGISSRKAIKKAKNKGLTVIVIDHHLAPKNEKNEQILPPADIIIDPHIEDESEFSDYCGAALAFRFAKEMFPDKKLKPLLVLASIATVTDVMPLVGPNRTLVKTGLEYINKGLVLPGLKVLLEKLELYDHITEGDYGFKIGPTFNAPGRLYDNGAEKVLNLLSLERDDVKIPFKADALVKINERRKELVKENMAIVDAILDNEKPIVLYDEVFHEGIVGILAGNLCESNKCPSIVFTDTENPDVIKGSGRSTEDVHLYNTLKKVKDKGLILQYGGHAGAAGLAIKKSNLDAFCLAFQEAVGQITSNNEDIGYDLELDIDHIEDCMLELKKYAPYGEGNPKPIFHMICDIKSSKFETMGDGSHFRILTENMTILGFNLTEKYNHLNKPNKIECIGTISERWHKDKCSLQFELIDFEKAL